MPRPSSPRVLRGSEVELDVPGGEPLRSPPRSGRSAHRDPPRRAGELPRAARPGSASPARPRPTAALLRRRPSRTRRERRTSYRLPRRSRPRPASTARPRGRRQSPFAAAPFEGALCARDRHGAGFAAVAVERQAFGTESSRGFDAHDRLSNGCSSIVPRHETPGATGPFARTANKAVRAPGWVLPATASPGLRTRRGSER